MSDPRPFAVHRDGVFLFTVYCYSAQQALALVTARLADTAGITITKGNAR
jgi:hypothetical protein